MHLAVGDLVGTLVISNEEIAFNDQRFLSSGGCSDTFGLGGRRFLSNPSSSGDIVFVSSPRSLGDGSAREG